MWCWEGNGGEDEGGWNTRIQIDAAGDEDEDEGRMKEKNSFLCVVRRTQSTRTPMRFLRAEKHTRESESTQSLHDRKGGPYGFGVVPFTLSLSPSYLRASECVGARVSGS